MPTLTATGAVNLTASTNWSPAQIPATGDDLIIGANTLTLDADITLGSLTFNTTTSRIALSGSTRTITVTNGVLFSAAISATAITITTGQTLTFIVGTGFRATANLAQFPFTNNGGTLNLYGAGSSTNSELIDATTANNMRLFTNTASAAVTNTRGRLSCGIGTHTLVTIAGGTWNHTHTGTTTIASVTGTSKVLTVSGSLTSEVNWNGDLSTTIPASTTGIFTCANSAATVNLTGNFEATDALAAGSLLHMTAGVMSLTGRAVHLTGTSSLTLNMTGGTFSWASQSVTIPSNRVFSGLAVGGSVVLNGLTVTNNNVWVLIAYGTTLVSATEAVITSTSGKAAAINVGSPAYYFLETGPATLPTAAQVQSGVSYGYTGSLLTGTGLIVDGSLASDVAAIKAKTDNLPSDPADASEIASSFSTVNSTLSTISGYLDTEVAAIKAKTDNLPADPADASDIAAAFSTVNSTLATIAGYIDTEIAAIKTKTDGLPSDTAATLTTIQGLVDTLETELAKVIKTGESRTIARAGKTSVTFTETRD